MNRKDSDLLVETHTMVTEMKRQMDKVDLPAIGESIRWLTWAVRGVYAGAAGWFLYLIQKGQ